MNEIERGEHAKRLLHDPLLQESLALIEENILDLWRETPDSKARNELWFTYKGLERFTNHLRTAISNGDFEKQIKE